MNPWARLQVGDVVVHISGHVGVIVRLDPHGLQALVKFVNTTSTVWVTDLRPHKEPADV